ncbi:LamG domain-containing protein [Candidatus Pacearchaeota archaeon]|nr:LamG domain-containing protein [Candidatus Pacearchaeota archaeon]
MEFKMKGKDYRLNKIKKVLIVAMFLIVILPLSYALIQTNQIQTFFAGAFNVNSTNEANFSHLEIEATAPYNSLVAYYPLDGDSPFSKINPSGKVSRARDFDGKDDLIIVDNSQGTNLTTNLTVSAWVKLNGLNGYQTIAGRWGVTGQQYKLGATVAGVGTPFLDISGTGSNDNYRVTASSITAGTWNHIAGVYNGTDIIMYLNGEISQGTLTGTVPSSAFGNPAQLSLGAQINMANLFNGSIDEVTIFNRSLTAGEILALYNNGTNGTHNSVTNGLVGQWNMDDTTNVKVLDSSGNNNHGAYQAGSNDIVTAYDYTSNNLDGTYTNFGNNQTFSNGVYDDAVSFDGKNDYITIADNAALESQAGANGVLSISQWVKQNSNSVNSAGAYDSAKSANNITLNQWTHVVVTFNNTKSGMVNKTTIYLNGVQQTMIRDVNSGTFTSISDTTQPVEIGRFHDGTLLLNGTLDELMIFSRELNSTEILDIYNNQSSRFKNPGTVETKSFNITSGNDKVNFTGNGFERNFNTNVSLRLGEWNISYDYNTSDLEGNNCSG